MLKKLVIVAAKELGYNTSEDGASDSNAELKQFIQTWKMQNANLKAKIPETGSPFDHYFDPEEGKWVKWKRKVVEYEPPAEDEEVMFSKIFIPTVQTV